MNRMDQLKLEMDPETNPLLPGSPAYKKQADSDLANDTGFAADDRRLQSGKYNPMIIGNEVGYPTIPPGEAGNGWVWNESRGLWFPLKG